MSLIKKLHQSKLPPSGHVLRSARKPNNKDFTLKSWKDFFDAEENVRVGTNLFHIYKRGSTGPLLFFLHGGGFSGLSWALLSKAMCLKVECTCIAVDLRGHGATVTDDDDLSAITLANDVCEILDDISQENPVVLIGHSMGGAIAVHASKSNRISTLAAVVVIDVVEGSAIDSLPAMHRVLANRPSAFRSIEKAHEWCVKSGYIRNLESARVSMIGQLKKQSKVANTDQPHSTSSQMGSIEEVEEETVTEGLAIRDDAQVSPNGESSGYVWRIDLSKTEKYWKGWFTGLSSSFLSIPAPKMLMLAGINNLDRELTIGQMQGKFQLQVLPKSGHAVHEDSPEQVAEALSSFLIRHRLTNPQSANQSIS